MRIRYSRRDSFPHYVLRNVFSKRKGCLTWFANTKQDPRDEYRSLSNLVARGENPFGPRIENVVDVSMEPN